jgi:probable addiction module antidote protein
MPKTSSATSYRDALIESLKDPNEAMEYLDACLRDGDPRIFLLALKDVADAHGGVRALSEATQLNRENLYRALSKSGNPSFQTLSAILGALGLRLSVGSAAPRKKRKVA